MGAASSRLMVAGMYSIMTNTAILVITLIGANTSAPEKLNKDNNLKKRPKCPGQVPIVRECLPIQIQIQIQIQRRRTVALPRSRIGSRVTCGLISCSTEKNSEPL